MRTKITVILMMALIGFASWNLFSADKTKDDYYRSAEYFRGLVTRSGPEVALNKARGLIQSGEMAVKICHPVMHAIGQAAAEKTQDFASAMSFAHDKIGSCIAGYVHGVIEGHFQNVNADHAVEAANDLCRYYNSHNTIFYGDCVHGVGHALMLITYNDLPRALKMCEGLDTGVRPCYGGAFMENFNSDPSTGHPSVYRKDDDSFYPCPDQDPKIKERCYHYAPDNFLNHHPADFAAALQWCLGAEREHQGDCLKRVSGLAIRENIKNPKTVEALCDRLPKENQQACIQGIASGYRQFFGSDDKADAKAKELCVKILEKKNGLLCQPQLQ